MIKYAFVTFLSVVSAESEACEDFYSTCESMARFCGSDSYAGVDTYCRKTCNNCDEARAGFAIETTTTASTTPHVVVVKQFGMFVSQLKFRI